MDKKKPTLKKSVRVPFTKSQKAAIKKVAKELGFNSMSSYLRFVITQNLKKEGYLDDIEIEELDSDSEE